MWNILKKLKSQEMDATCDWEDKDLYFSPWIDSLIDEIEKKLKFKASTKVLNITTAKANTAGKMFLFLNSCSPTFKTLPIFLKNIFKHKSPLEIVLTLNRLLKGGDSKGNIGFKKVTRKLFQRTAAEVSLNYMNFQNINFRSTW